MDVRSPNDRSIMVPTPCSYMGILLVQGGSWPILSQPRLSQPRLLELLVWKQYFWWSSYSLAWNLHCSGYNEHSGIHWRHETNWHIKNAVPGCGNHGLMDWSNISLFSIFKVSKLRKLRSRQFFYGFLDGMPFSPIIHAFAVTHKAEKLKNHSSPKRLKEIFVFHMSNLAGPSRFKSSFKFPILYIFCVTFNVILRANVFY